MESTIIANKYRIVSKIGSGQFGTVFHGKYLKKDECVAIKTEHKDCELQTLKHEANILNYLYSRGSTNTPSVYWYGIYETYFTLIMPLYEMSLEDMIRNREVSKMQIMKTGSKMIDILETIHRLGILHRDLKPQNFMMRNDELYLIDFGLSTVYMDDKYNIFPKRPDSLEILGTPKFVSIRIHDGEDPSRSDDCISAIYILQYLLQDGHVHWENIQEEQTKNEYSENHILYYKNAIRKQIKKQHQNEIDITTCCGMILEYLYENTFYEQPKYQWIRSVLHT